MKTFALRYGGRSFSMAVAGLYNNQVARADAQPLMPEDVQKEIADSVPAQSAFMSMARKLPNMSRNQRRLPILSTLVTAAFVSGTTPGSNDTGLKQTSKEAWENKFIDAEELAVIVPIPENVLNDADYDLWAEVKPRIIEAFGIAIDAACFFGTNQPTSWPTSLKQASINASTRVVKGSLGDIYDDVLGDGGLVNKLEAVGYMPSGYIAAPAFRGKLRGLRDAVGQPLFRSGSQAQSPQGALQGMTQFELDGNPILFSRNGAFDPTQALMFCGDWNQVVYAIRQDITYKILDQAAIFDSSNVLQFNLPQQDMIALRAVMRLGWQVPNPVNRLQTNEALRYPVAAYTP